MNLFVEPSSTILQALTFVCLGLAVYAVILFLLRRVIHRSFSRLGGDKRLRVVQAWSHTLLATRASLLILPIVFAAMMLGARLAGADLTPTLPFLLLLYVNVALIYLDRRWHLAQLPTESESQDERAA